MGVRQTLDPCRSDACCLAVLFAEHAADAWGMGDHLAGHVPMCCRSAGQHGCDVQLGLEHRQPVSGRQVSRQSKHHLGDRGSSSNAATNNSSRATPRCFALLHAAAHVADSCDSFKPASCVYVVCTDHTCHTPS